MNYLTVFGISFAVALSGALMPGPLLTTVIAESTRKGFQAGPYICIGHAILEACMVALIIAGLSQAGTSRPVVYGICVGGAAILLYFGISMLASARRLSLTQDVSATRSAHPVLLGITVSLANPYWTMWWLTAGAGLLIASRKQGWPALAAFFLGHIAADFAWYSIIAWGFSRSRKILSDRIYRGIIVLCGLTLIAFAVYFGVVALHDRL
ncbi:MAG: LysE family transporter [Candidatus Omnitrophica bacterium]|nr:LysE family transporter [Candidatus Omnitrophota bacterium]